MPTQVQIAESRTDKPPTVKAAGLLGHFASLGERKLLLLIILLAFAVRLYVMFHTVVIANDGVIYIEMAKLFEAGRFETSLIANYPPLYPIMILGMHHVIEDWVLAGQTVSIIFSCLLLLPLYAMTRRFFNARIALLSVFFAALSPYLVRFSTDVLTEAPYIFLFITAVWLGWGAMTDNRPRLLLLSGLCAGLAYLLRPEGIGVLLVVAAWVLLPVLQPSRRPMLQRILLVCLMGAITLAVAFPYMAYMKHETGSWRLSKKKEVAVLLGIRKSNDQAVSEKSVATADARDPAALDSPNNFGTELLDEATARPPAPATLTDHLYVKLRVFLKMLGLFAESYHPLLMFFAFLGFLLSSYALHNRRAGIYVLSFVFLYGIVLYRLLLCAYYLDRRHLVPLAVITLAWAAVGMNALVGWLGERRQRSEGGNLTLHKITAVLLVLTALVMLPKTLKPVRMPKYHQKSVGIWLKSQTHEAPVIMAYNLPRVAFYAEGKYVPYRRGSYNALLALARERNVQYLVVDRESVERQIAGFFDHVTKRQDLVLVHEEGKLNDDMHDDLLVYAVRTREQP